MMSKKTTAIMSAPEGLPVTLRVHSMDALSAWVHLIDWSRVSGLRGVGPLDSRPSLKAGPFAPTAKALNMAGFTRTETEDVVDAAAALQESITYLTTGAVASPSVERDRSEQPTPAALT